MPTAKSGVPDYIWISKWETFQHYVPKRDVPPAWIKTYPKQLSDDRYLDLTAAQRAILHDLRCEFATSAGRLLNDTRRLSQRTGLRITNAQLEALNNAGFIEFLSRADLDRALEEFYASRAPARSLEEQEEETDTDEEKESSSRSSNPNPPPEARPPARDPDQPPPHTDADEPELVDGDHGYLIPPPNGHNDIRSLNLTAAALFAAGQITHPNDH